MIINGSRVKVFDILLFKDDKSTPISFTCRPATVLRRYGYRSERYGIYPDCCDVVFDHRPTDLSKGHFTHLIEELSP